MWWVNIYTKYVQSEAANCRRDELISDLHEQYAAGCRAGLPPKAVSRSVLWRAVRGIPSDLRWGNAHHQRKGTAVDMTTGDRGARRLFHGMNILWIVLAGMFILGIGATAAEYFVRGGDLLGRLYFGSLGLGVSGLLVLTSMALFVTARVLQLIIQGWTNRRHPSA